MARSLRHSPDSNGKDLSLMAKIILVGFLGICAVVLYNHETPGVTKVVLTNFSNALAALITG